MSFIIRAQVYEAKDDLKRALEDYDRAIALEPNNPRAATLRKAALAGAKQAPETSSSVASQSPEVRMRAVARPNRPPPDRRRQQ